jgi:sirohydrochlorin cobaltochelatase
MLPPIERVLSGWIASGTRRIGEILIAASGQGFSLCHRDDEAKTAGLTLYDSPNDAAEIAKFDDAGNYRPLKTSPNLRHGWRLELVDLAALRLALDLFYPGRLAALTAWEGQRLVSTSLRQTLARQSGMYRVAARISDDEVNVLVGRFCASRGGEPGCLRTILWRRDDSGAVASTRLAQEKFNPEVDQSGRGERALPLLCQEACNLLVAEARKVVKGDGSNEPAE